MVLDLLHLFDGDDEDGVGTGRRLVHVGSGCGPRFGSNFHQFEDLLRSDYCPLRDTLNINAFSGVFPDLQVFLLVSKQVTDDFVIDLYVGSADHVGSL